MRIGEFEIKMPEKPLRDPHCLAFLSPWINSGNVGEQILNKIQASHNASNIGQMVNPGKFYDFTRYRPTLRDVNGRREFIIPNTTLSLIQFDDKKINHNDIILLHILEPHNLSEKFNQALVTVLKKLGITRYLLLGSMYNMVPHTRTFPVSGRTQNWDMPEALLATGVRPPQYQGAASLVSMVTETLARKSKIETLTLIVNLPVYNRANDNYMGIARLMNVINRLYSWVEVDKATQDKAAAMKKQLDNDIRSDTTLKQLVEQIETAFDQYEQDMDKKDIGPLAPEVQHFLDAITEPPPSDGTDSGSKNQP